MTDPEAVEFVARALCSSEYMDPDLMVVSGEPYRVRGGYAVGGEPHALWQDYAYLARTAIDAVEQLPADYLEKLTA